MRTYDFRFDTKLIQSFVGLQMISYKCADSMAEMVDIQIGDNAYCLTNEYEEYDPIYKAFGDKAAEEGFSRVAASFHMISAIEKTHGDRFGKFAQLMEQNRLFVSDVETGWICLNCGYVYTGTNAPEKCPVCDHDKGYFIRVSMAPFSE